MSRALLAANDLRDALRRRHGAYLRVTCRAFGPPERAALCVGSRAEPVYLPAALLLVRSGEVVEEIARPLVTDYVLAGDAAEAEPEAPEPAPVLTLGSEITTAEAVRLLGLRSRMSAYKVVSRAPLTARYRQAGTPARRRLFVVVDERLLREMERRNRPYVVEQTVEERCEALFEALGSLPAVGQGRGRVSGEGGCLR